MYRSITKAKKEKTKKEKLRNILASSLAGAMFAMIPAAFIIILAARWLAVVIIMSGALFGAIYHHVFE